MTNMNEGDKRKLSGCALAVAVVLGAAALATIIVLLYVLVQFGSFLGGL